MTIPNALYIECPNCGERTLHEVLKGKMGQKRQVMEATVRCKECGHIHSAVIRVEKPNNVPVVLSDQGRSRRESIELGSEELISIDDELFVDDIYTVVTSIEQGGRRVERAPAGEIDTLWVKRYDRIRLKISVNKGQKTIPSKLFAMPDEEFHVGDIITTGREKAVINKMKTSDGMVKEGGAEAREIVRIYAKVMKVINA